MFSRLAVPALALLVSIGAETSSPVHAKSQELLPVLRAARAIGCSGSDCRELELLSAMSLALRPDGTVLVLDEFEPFVRIFDSTGLLVGTAGPRGEGPGELAAPGRIYLNADNSFIVYNGMPPSLVLFAKSGEGVGSIRLPMGVSVSTAYDRVNSLLYMVTFSLSDRAGRLVSIPMDGSGPRSVLTTDRLPARRGEEGSAAEFAVAVGPAGQLAVGNTHTYQIRLYDTKGITISEFHRDIPRPRKSEAELEEETRGRRANRREPDAEKPHFRNDGIQYDDWGRIWILTERGGPRESIFDLFGEDGRYLGSLTVDAPALRRTRAFDVCANELAMIVLDNEGNTFVRIWEIES